MAVSSGDRECKKAKPINLNESLSMDMKTVNTELDDPQGEARKTSTSRSSSLARFERFGTAPTPSPQTLNVPTRSGAASGSQAARSDLPLARRSPTALDRPGTLRGGVVLHLHTHVAQKMWNGRRPDRGTGKQGIKSIPHFASQLKTINFSAAKDDPYADWWLIQMQDAVDECRVKLRELSDALDSFMKSQMPDEVQIVEALSQKPLAIEIHFEAPLAYQAAYLLADYDKLARRVLMVRHYGLLARAQSEQLLDQGGKLIRSLLSRIDGWRFTGVTRDDVAANNQRAQSAKEKMGDCPADILRGDRRSGLAPLIRRDTGIKALESAVPEATESE